MILGCAFVEDFSINTTDLLKKRCQSLAKPRRVHSMLKKV